MYFFYSIKFYLYILALHFPDDELFVLAYAKVHRSKVFTVNVIDSVHNI